MGQATNTTEREFGPIKTATINGTTLAYREEGQGEPVVFVHGGISDLRTWAQQVPAIGTTHRAIAYSRRSYRPNERVDPTESDLIALAPDDLAAFLREIDVVPAHLVGNSAGGLFSLLVAIRWPDLVRSLVLEEPAVAGLFLSDPPRAREVFRLFATRPRAAVAILRYGLNTVVAMTRIMRSGDEERAARSFTRGALGTEAYERLSPDRWAQVMDNLSELHAYASGTSSFPPIDDEGVRSIRAPVLLMTSEHGPAALRYSADRLEELLPNVERVEIPDASHLMHEDNPPVVNQVILEFLSRHRDQHTG